MSHLQFIVVLCILISVLLFVRCLNSLMFLLTEVVWLLRFPFVCYMQRLSGPPGMAMDWQGAPPSPSSYTVKRILRLEIPVDAYPTVSFSELAKFMISLLVLSLHTPSLSLCSFCMVTNFVYMDCSSILSVDFLDPEETH